MGKNSYHAIDYMLKTSPPQTQRNPRKFEIVYTNRYESVISLPAQSYNAAIIESARLREMGLEPIIKEITEELVNA